MCFILCNINTLCISTLFNIILHAIALTSYSIEKTRVDNCTLVNIILTILVLLCYLFKILILNMPEVFCIFLLDSLEIFEEYFFIGRYIEK